MFLVNLSKSWPLVLAGERDAADATLAEWAQIKDADLERYGDTVLGIFRNQVVTAFDIDRWTRGENMRVTFTGRPSQKWDYLIGTPTPGKPWVRGQARPIQVLPTSVLTDGTVPVEKTPSGRRAVVDGYVLTVSEAGSAMLQVPNWGNVTVSVVSP